MDLKLSFNPCFNGCASRITNVTITLHNTAGFNPCFNGCASRIVGNRMREAHPERFQSLF